jgi:hypothetical protein
LVTLSALLGVVTMTALAETNQTSTDSVTATTSTSTDTTTASTGSGMQMMDQGGMGGHGGKGHQNSNIEISSEYNATVTAILQNDTDVANLLSQGYNVTSIHPIIKTVVAGDGTVTSKATTATVTLTNGTTGYAKVTVDIANSKVTYIETVTRTVIDKSST